MLSLVIPVYNEEGIIIENTEKLIGYLDGLSKEYEVIICSNGSTDSTVEKGRELQSRFPGKVRFFSIPVRGVGLAFKKAVSESRYNYIISIDMDLSTDNRFIGEALDLLKDHDIVIGSKKVGDQERSIFRVLISSGFIYLVKILLDMDYTDYSIGSKAYRKSVIERWIDRIDYGSSYVIELIYYAKENGFRITEIPVFCDDRRSSRFNLAHEVVYRFKNLIRLWFWMNIRKGKY
jgi:glycosyltransferase involved in cell wall biosynthesis